MTPPTPGPLPRSTTRITSTSSSTTTGGGSSWHRGSRGTTIWNANSLRGHRLRSPPSRLAAISTAPTRTVPPTAGSSPASTHTGFWTASVTTSRKRRRANSPTASCKSASSDSAGPSGGHDDGQLVAVAFDVHVGPAGDGRHRGGIVRFGSGTGQRPGQPSFVRLVEMTDHGSVPVGVFGENLDANCAGYAA